jgi:hypothetical protein
MSQLIEEQLGIILQSFGNFPGGANLGQIAKASGLNLPVRTLQRRLDTLYHRKIITTAGKTKGLTYHLVNQDGKTLPESRQNTSLIPLSGESKAIIESVSKPLSQRIPVAYNRDFLDSYRPGIDNYLSKAQKENLARLGNTAKLDQPAGTYAKQILHRLLIDLSWNSSRLEGNTYSLLDTERLISQGVKAGDKTDMDTQMILNHKEAIEFIVEGAHDIGLNRHTVLNLHALLSDNLLPDVQASGRLRTIAVGISNTVYTPSGIPQLIAEMFDIMLEKVNQVNDPFEQAFFIMVQLPYLQPFDDVNKRVSRLAANIPLNRYNYAPLSFTDVPNDLYIQGLTGIYELNKPDLLRDVFLWAYERSAAQYAVLRQSLGEPDAFRLKYREAIRHTVYEIIAEQLAGPQAELVARDKARELPEADQGKFEETIIAELHSLHEGNIARYRIRPSQFKEWKSTRVI